MSKRLVTELVESGNQDGKKKKKATTDSIREPTSVDEMGEFEDAWEDEIESDEDVIYGDSETDQHRNGMDVDEILPALEESVETSNQEAFIPGRHELGKDEILEPDDSAYIMRHSMNVNWPCLSFDVLRDNFGDERQRYPATMYLVTGSQADIARNNEISVHKLSSLHRTQNDGDSDFDDEGDDHLDEDPVVEFRTIPHLGGINRIRAQPLHPSSPLPPFSQPYYVASWGDTGKVQIFNIRPLIESLDTPGYVFDRSSVHNPIFTINSHDTAEGFAMDWASSGPTSLRLVTGDVHSKIYLTITSPSGFNSLSQPFLTHTSSVEDLQWSPSEPTVFASCSADCSIQIWDVRSKARRSITGISPAHEGDVNVISWNKSASHLLVSGGDDGGIKVWDLRNVKKKGNINQVPTPVAAYAWHAAPVTSIEWNPTEDSIFVASGADDQVTLWDLAVEEDDDEAGNSSIQNIPSQLLFIHQGQKDVKEVHWHPQMPGTVISTALDGLDIFKTISV